MSDADLTPLSDEELAAEGGAALPDKEVISLLDLNADLDLGLDAAAPIDLAVAANANVAAPIDAAVGANVLSSRLRGAGARGPGRHHRPGHHRRGRRRRHTGQHHRPGGGHLRRRRHRPTARLRWTPTDPTDTGSVMDGDLLDVDVDLAADLDLAAPITGAVAANANVAAPIDAAVAANVGSIDSDATAIAEQDAIITQDIDADAEATTDQTSNISQ